MSGRKRRLSLSGDGVGASCDPSKHAFTPCSLSLATISPMLVCSGPGVGACTVRICIFSLRHSDGAELNDTHANADDGPRLFVALISRRH